MLCSRGVYGWETLGFVLWFKGPISSRFPRAEIPPENNPPPQGSYLTPSYWILPWQIPSTINFDFNTPHGGLRDCFGHTPKSILIWSILFYTAISCSLTSFVSQQVGDASELFRYGAGPHHRPRDLGVFLNHPTENHLPHIQIDTQTASNENSKYIRFTALHVNTIKHSC